MRKKGAKKDSVISIAVTTIIIMLITAILSLIGLEGQQTIITANGTLETYLITTNNIFSIEGQEGGKIFYWGKYAIDKVKRL